MSWCHAIFFSLHVLTSEDLERLLNQDRKVPILGEWGGGSGNIHGISCDLLGFNLYNGDLVMISGYYWGFNWNQCDLASNTGDWMI
jgi:hypothetical protein